MWLVAGERPREALSPQGLSDRLSDRQIPTREAPQRGEAQELREIFELKRKLRSMQASVLARKPRSESYTATFYVRLEPTLMEMYRDAPESVKSLVRKAVRAIVKGILVNYWMNGDPNAAAGLELEDARGSVVNINLNLNVNEARAEAESTSVSVAAGVIADEIVDRLEELKVILEGIESTLKRVEETLKRSGGLVAHSALDRLNRTKAYIVSARRTMSRLDELARKLSKIASN